MLTCTLEKLVLCGDATVGTFQAGGAASNTLKVPEDRFIIILQMIHFPYLPVEDVADPAANQDSLVTQMQVLSDKTVNSFVFRNNFNYGITLGVGGTLENWRTPGTPTTVNTYLVHESDVGFNFSKGIAPRTAAVGIKPIKAPARRPEFGYGREGINTAIGNTPVELDKLVFTKQFRPMGELTPPTAGLESYTELSYPIINGVSNLQPTEIDNTTGFPLVQVTYVSIKGNPTNLQASI